MLISEIFYSIQGEGPNIGIPAIFVRLGGCNLRCKWCDTKYAYNGTNMTIKEVANRIQEIQRKEGLCKHMVFTGGEPMLQQSEMYALIEELISKDIASYFEVETNGTILPRTEKVSLINQWNVSPKSEYEQTVKKWNEIDIDYDKVFFKFVIDSKETLEKLKNIKQISHHAVGFMPQGQTRKEVEKNSKWLIEECKKLRIRFCPRLHIQIWDKKRGV